MNAGLLPKATPEQLRAMYGEHYTGPKSCEFCGRNHYAPKEGEAPLCVSQKFERPCGRCGAAECKKVLRGYLLYCADCADLVAAEREAALAAAPVPEEEIRAFRKPHYVGLDGKPHEGLGDTYQRGRRR